jgi:cytochrome c biogenesis protein CcdA
MPTISLLGTTTPSAMLTAVGVTVGSVWDSYYLFFAFAAGLAVAFILIRFVLSLIAGRRSRR